jgi:hypothetical protein
LTHVLLGILIAGAAVFYFIYNPGENGFFPRCPFLAITGYECPGCGSQRAVHHLLHGRVAEAWSMNPLLVVMIPYLLLGVAVGFFYYRYTRTANPRYAWAAWARKNLYGATAAWVILAVVVLFTVFRNIFGF